MHETKTDSGGIPRLIICGGGNPVQFPLHQRFITLGRGEKNAIQIERASISYWHLEFHQLTAGRYKVVDLDSRNGTTVNGISVGSCELADGDRIEMGRDIVIHYFVHQDVNDEFEFEPGDLCQYQSIDERIKAIRDEQSQLQRNLRKKTLEYATLLESIAALKQDPEAAYREIYGTDEIHYPARTDFRRNPVGNPDDLVLPA